MRPSKTGEKSQQMKLSTSVVNSVKIVYRCLEQKPVDLKSEGMPHSHLKVLQAASVFSAHLQ